MVGIELWKTCYNYGPLLVHNCFPFESFYGTLLTYKSGTHHYQSQLYFMSGFKQALNYLFNFVSTIDNSSYYGKLAEKMKLHVPFSIKYK